MSEGLTLEANIITNQAQLKKGLVIIKFSQKYIQSLEYEKDRSELQKGTLRKDLRGIDKNYETQM